MSAIESRNLDIYRRKKSGETFVAIGKLYGISCSRAAQIFHMHERRLRLPKAAHWPKDMSGWRDMEIGSLWGLPSKVVNVCKAEGFTRYGQLDEGKIMHLQWAPNFGKQSYSALLRHYRLVLELAGEI